MRETKAQKASRMTFTLGELDRITRELRKLTKQADELKAQVRKEAPGTYGDWVLGTGTPREILDQPAARDALTKAGIPIPTKMTDAPIVITNKAAS
jgi:hypothetical protein